MARGSAGSPTRATNASGLARQREAAFAPTSRTHESPHGAEWADRFHHEVHVLLTGEQEGYYERFGSLRGLAEEYRRRPAEKLVVCAQNHDQVGNRAIGDRLPREALRIAAACVLFAPQT